MKKLLFAAIILFVFIGCSEKPWVPDTGIPKALAEYRKAQLSGVTYDLFLNLPDEKEDPIDGRINISFELKEKSDVIFDFNVPPAHYSYSLVNDVESSPIVENEHIIFPADNFREGRNTVSIEFRAGDQSLNRNEDYLYTLFVPDRASTCFPVFDQPDIKATYSLALEMPRDWEAVFNGPFISDDISGERKSVKFGTSGPIPSYLFAFAAGKFEVVESQHDDMTMRMYHRETDSLKVAMNSESIFKLHRESIDWLENYTGIDYPFEKFDFALLPPFQYGGMEHPGAIFYRQSSLFLDESATINQELGRASLIAHETAHMWFGNLVTMEWFNDVWMKEVFANFMAAKMVNPQFPEVDHDLRFLLSHYPRAFGIDRSEGKHPVRQELDNLKNAGTLYGAVIYQKAPIVMKQLELLIGEENMRESLAEYLQEFSYGNATWDDLVKIIDKRTKEDINSWSNKWVYGSGLPVINNRLEESTLVFNHKNESDWLNQKFSVMSVPSENSFSVLLDKPVTRLEVQEDDTLFLVNSDGLGYAYFEFTEGQIQHLFSSISSIDDDVMRGAMWVQLWENLLNGNINPVDFHALIENHLPNEDNPLILNRILGYSGTLFWRFLDPLERQSISAGWEEFLMKNMKSTSVSGGSMMFFRALRSTVTTASSLDFLYRVHRGSEIIEGVRFGESDKINNVLTLALHGYPGSEQIIDSLYQSFTNPDRREQLAFVRKAVSPERDSFFDSLKDPVNREHEPWVNQAMNLYFHPMRENQTVEKIFPALELLEEIQVTGDIFFPKAWADGIFGGHQSNEAITELDRFLDDHPNLSSNLRNKVLQSADITKRAALIRGDEQLNN